MIELERFDLETRDLLGVPFYLLEDGSKINSLVFRSPADHQYACLNAETFEQCKKYLQTWEMTEKKRLFARTDADPNAIYWFAERLDKLWTVSEITNIDDWYRHSRFVGHLSGDAVRRLLPRTYQRFQSKREELAEKQAAFERWVNSLRTSEAVEALF